ncbi:MAG: hypothetical protein RIE53_00665 [Rhodothermales bacterium]
MKNSIITREYTGAGARVGAIAMAIAVPLLLLCTTGTAAAQDLTEAGNDAFGTIQEVIAALAADPATDWSTVDIEALRRHLLDMHDMTLNVTVEQSDIANGLQAMVTPTTDRAARALERVFAAHPQQLAAESGWAMQAMKHGDAWHVMVTSDDEADVPVIRGLGYIGVMAWGAHHQPHHRGIATGQNPHGDGAHEMGGQDHGGHGGMNH